MLEILHYKTLYICSRLCVKGFCFEKEYLSRQQSALAEHLAKRESNIKTKSVALFVIFC